MVVYGYNPNIWNWRRKILGGSLANQPAQPVRDPISKHKVGSPKVWHPRVLSGLNMHLHTHAPEYP